MENLNLLNKKFQSLVNGTTGHEFNGICGTNQDVRSAIVKEVYTSLPENIKVLVNGVVVDFKKNTSLSGKTICFVASLTNEQYLQIAPDSPFKKKGGATISLGATGQVEVRNGGNYWFRLENKQVTIL